MLEIIAEKYNLFRSEAGGKILRAGAIQILESLDIDWKAAILKEGFCTKEELDREAEKKDN